MKTRSINLAALGFLLLVGRLASQIPEAAFQFEVASIRPSSPDARGTQINVTKGTFQLRNASPRFMIQYAYDLSPAQVVGGPAWIQDARFDVAAKDAEDPSSGSSLNADVLARRRLRSLLESRFDLKLRTEQRETPVFILTVDQGQSKLKPTVNGRGTININRNNADGTMRGDGLTTKALAEALGRLVERPVVNETVLDGEFDFELTWSDRENGDAPSIFISLREQLGLRLEAARRSITVSIVDAISQPSEN